MNSVFTVLCECRNSIHYRNYFQHKNMESSSIANRKYTYLRDRQWPSEAIEVHHIMVRKSAAKGFFKYISAGIFLVNALYLVLVEERSASVLFWGFPLSAVFVSLLLRNSVDKESVVVMPAFGVQLETHYRSERTVRHFIPIDKILKPVLLECVTPITCYWSLSLIMHGEEEMTLVFKIRLHVKGSSVAAYKLHTELRPPVKMLVPIWRALCAATGSKESQDKFIKDGQSC